MIDINEDKPEYGELVLVAVTLDKDARIAIRRGPSTPQEEIDASDILDWENGVYHSIFSRNEDGLFVITPLQWRPEYADTISHWMPYPEHPALVKSKDKNYA